MPSTYHWTDIGDTPLVSCIMPTYGRPKLVPESVSMFLAQDYPHKELIILNDCPGQEYVGELPGVKIINLASRCPTLGEKRNRAIDAAQGSLIAVWDDDDVYLPWRLSYCVERSLALTAPLLLVRDYWAYWGEPALHHNQAVPGWISHPLAMFRKDLWHQAGGYPQQTLGEDSVFFGAVLKLMEAEWMNHDIDQLDRFLILRGKSEYYHTSIGGGEAPADDSKQVIELAPAPIADPVLRRAAERLVLTRCGERRSPCASPTADCPEHVTFLDDVSAHKVRVGYGNLGQHGSLGYEGKSVEIWGRRFSHALSTHGPAELRFALDGKSDTFRSRVAINDDVAPGQSAADFLAFADDRLVGIATNVQPRDMQRGITADIRGAKELQLVVRAHRSNCCHAVWTEPRVERSNDSKQATLNDCLQLAEIAVPKLLPESELCIATVGSPGFEDWIDDLFGSVCANGQCPEAQLVLFFFDENDEAKRLAAKYDAILIPCQSRRPLDPASKSVLYSAARVLRSQKLICLDADMLVLDDLRPIASSIDSQPPGSVFVCREKVAAADLNEAIRSIYGGMPEDVDRLLNGSSHGEGHDSFVVNDGLFAGTRAALCGVDELIRDMTNAPSWLDQGAAYPWRNQFVFNLALAHLRCGVELDSRFNVQLNCQSIEVQRQAGTPVARSEGRKATVVHFNGGGRGKHGELRGQYRGVRSPLIKSTAPGDGYGIFCDALRSWVGQRGIERLTWSFYGTSDGCNARVTDSSFFPLLATLHSLIRSNGCARVIETGTAHGVSAACLASAIAHRDASLVVSLDPAVFPDREELWSLLPARMRACIQARQVDAITGLTDALRQQETFHAALLDSIHTSEHVMQEFELATRLVCSGGLILIHDPLWSGGTVDHAIEQIARRGYRVVRLWSADDGVREDDRLGLAIVENRCLRAST